MSSDTFEHGDLVVLDTESKFVKSKLSIDGKYYSGFYRTVIEASSSRRVSSGLRKFIGPRRSDSAGIILGLSFQRQTDKIERAYILWDGEILETRLDILCKVEESQ